MPATDWFAGRRWAVFCHYLGDYWCRGEPRFPDEFAVGYTQHVTGQGGIMTWDVPITHDGRIPDASIAQLSAVGAAVRRE